jgi:hypothetical protein
VCITAGLVAGLLPHADARTRRKRSTFQVALQPFSVVRAAVHAVADPIVHNAPQVIYKAATAPIRVARAVAVDRPRGEDAAYDEDDDYYGDDREPIAAAQPRARVAQRVDYGQPIRVAYVVPRYQAAQPPRAEQADDDAADDSSAPYQDFEPQEQAFESSRSKPMVPGSRAVLRNGIAYAPSHAPQSVKNAIWAANSLQRKPYIWGGGHGSFYDRGYDCSGTVSFALHAAGALRTPLPSSDFLRYGERGRGRWITVYSRRGHTFAMIAGLRLDTTDFRNGGNTGPRWHVDARDMRGYVARHPAGM